MDKSFVINWLLNNYKIVISAAFALAFFIVNIILGFKNHDINRIKQALLMLPDVINSVEAYKMSSVAKKILAEDVLKQTFGKSFFNKYSELLNDAIEDILSTPQKKGGSQ